MGVTFITFDFGSTAFSITTIHMLNLHIAFVFFTQPQKMGQTLLTEAQVQEKIKIPLGKALLGFRKHFYLPDLLFEYRDDFPMLFKTNAIGKMARPCAIEFVVASLVIQNDITMYASLLPNHEKIKFCYQHKHWTLKSCEKNEIVVHARAMECLSAKYLLSLDFVPKEMQYLAIMIQMDKPVVVEHYLTPVFVEETSVSIPRTVQFAAHLKLAHLGAFPINFMNQSYIKGPVLSAEFCGSQLAVTCKWCVGRAKFLVPTNQLPFYIAEYPCTCTVFLRLQAASVDAKPCMEQYVITPVSHIFEKDQLSISQGKIDAIYTKPKQGIPQKLPLCTYEFVECTSILSLVSQLVHVKIGSHVNTCTMTIQCNGIVPQSFTKSCFAYDLVMDYTPVARLVIHFWNMQLEVVSLQQEIWLCAYMNEPIHQNLCKFPTDVVFY